MSDKPHVVLSGQFTMELTPVGEGQIASQITSVGFSANSLGLGIAIGQLIAWFLEGCEKELARAPALELNTEEKRTEFNSVMMREINLGIVRSLMASTKIPEKGKQQ